MGINQRHDQTKKLGLKILVTRLSLILSFVVVVNGLFWREGRSREAFLKTDGRSNHIFLGPNCNKDIT